MVTRDDDKDGMSAALFTFEERAVWTNEKARRAIDGRVRAEFILHEGKAPTVGEVTDAVEAAITRETLRRQRLHEEGRAIITHHSTPQAVERYFVRLTVAYLFTSPFTLRERVILGLQVDRYRDNGVRARPSRCVRFIRSAIQGAHKKRFGRTLTKSEVDEVLLTAWTKLILARAKGKGVPQSDRRPAIAKYFAVIAVNEHFPRRRKAKMQVLLAAPQSLDSRESNEPDIVSTLRASRIDLIDAIIRYLDRKCPRMREIFTRHVLYGQAFKAIAAALRLSCGTVSRMWRDHILPCASGIISDAEAVVVSIRGQLAARSGDLDLRRIFDLRVGSGLNIQRISRELCVSPVVVRHALSKRAMPVAFRTLAHQPELCRSLRQMLASSGRAHVGLFDAIYLDGFTRQRAASILKLRANECRDLLATTIHPMMVEELRRAF